MVPAPAPYHQETSARIYLILNTFVTERDIGRVYYAPCDVMLSEENVVQPDIFFISKERKHIIGEKNIKGIPDLVVEILSPYTEKIDRTLKVEL